MLIAFAVQRTGEPTDFVLQPWHLLVTALAGWVDRQQQAAIEDHRSGTKP